MRWILVSSAVLLSPRRYELPVRKADGTIVQPDEEGKPIKVFIHAYGRRSIWIIEVYFHGRAESFHQVQKKGPVVLSSQYKKTKLPRNFTQVPFIATFKCQAVVFFKQRYVPDEALKEITFGPLNFILLADDVLLSRPKEATDISRAFLPPRARSKFSGGRSEFAAPSPWLAAMPVAPAMVTGRTLHVT